MLRERLQTSRCEDPPAEFAGTLKAVFSKKDSVSYIFRKDLKDGVTVKILAVVD